MSDQAPSCPLVDRCGGCPAMSLSPEAQQEMRANAIQRALRRMPDRIVSSPQTLNYRARILLRVGADGRLGYHLPRSNTHLPITRCPIARPEIEAALQHLPTMPTGLGGVELRSDGASVILSAHSRQRHGRRARRKRRGPTVQPAALRDLLKDAPLDGVALDGRSLTKRPATTHLTVAGITHRLQPQTFYQVNLEVNALLVDTVRQYIKAASPSRVLDLYSGAGNLSLPLAAAGISTHLIEQSPSAVADARATVARHQLSGVEITQADAGAFEAGQSFFDVALLDPPRAGAPGVLRQLTITRPRRIVYISCNPSALARDLREADAAGYTVARLEMFDMFPQTRHVEVLCVLDR